MEELSEQPKKILMFIKNNNEETLSVTNIAKNIKASYGNVLKSINKLDKLKIIEKTKTSNNRIKIKLTKSGKEFISSYF